MAQAGIECFVAWCGVATVSAEWSVQEAPTSNRQYLSRSTHQADCRLPRCDVDHVDADNRVRPLKRPVLCCSVERDGRKNVGYALRFNPGIHAGPSPGIGIAWLISKIGTLGRGEIQIRGSWWVVDQKHATRIAPAATQRPCTAKQYRGVFQCREDAARNAPATRPVSLRLSCVASAPRT